jgi:hypothetical protein
VINNYLNYLLGVNMKFVKVTALAAAMMATFGAQAELAAMDDAALEAVTGQSGITITQATTINVFAFTDADGDETGTAFTSAGSLRMENISLSGDVTIDVGTNGGNTALVIGMGAQTITTDLGLVSSATTALADATTLGALRIETGASTLSITAH